MIWLESTIAEAKKYVLDSIPSYWNDITSITSNWLETSFSPETIIPIACCKAVGSDPGKAVSIATSLAVSLMSVRILDDLQDKDKPDALWAKVGAARAFNYAFAFQTIAYKIMGNYPYENAQSKKIFETYIEGALVTLAGQDRDLQGQHKSWEDYWRTAEMKTCYITSSGAAMGAMAGTTNEEWINACKVYGYHWGLTLQILNDLEGIWEAEGTTTDLEQGKATLPVLYGMRCQHPAQNELSMIVWQDKIAEHAERIIEILDNIDARSYLIWAALKQREKALEAIQILPDIEGKKALEYYITSVFGDIDELLNKTYEPKELHNFDIPDKIPTLDQIIAQPVNGLYRSSALGIRSRLRMSNN